MRKATAKASELYLAAEDRLFEQEDCASCRHMGSCSFTVRECLARTERDNAEQRSFEFHACVLAFASPIAIGLAGL